MQLAFMLNLLIHFTFEVSPGKGENTFFVVCMSFNNLFDSKE